MDGAMTGFDADRFEVTSLEAARAIILTPGAHSTAERWATETPYIAGLAIKWLHLTAGMMVADYGCGVGRIGLEIARRAFCLTVGFDVSRAMRALALKSGFPVQDRDRIDDVEGRWDAAVAVWILQHAEYPAQDIDRLHRALKPGGRILVVNDYGRRVPTHDGGWHDDGIDVMKLLEARFTREVLDTLSLEHVDPAAAATAYWAVFRKSA